MTDKQVASESKGQNEALLIRLSTLRTLLAEKKGRQKFKLFLRHKPWPKQWQVLNAKTRVVFMFGGNRTGKTRTGAYWITCHLTGDYPEGWDGRKFREPTDCWAAGISVETTREIIQMELLGDIRQDANVGSGMIPKDHIADYRMKQGNPDTVDTVYVKHFTDGFEDGLSTLTLKSMEQGRGKFQGTARHAIWLDEQSKRGDTYDIFSESMTRTLKLENVPEGGQVLVTLSPLEGMDELCKYALIKSINDPSVTVVHVSWDEAPHLDPETCAALEKSLLPHEIEARKYGRPVIKEGLVFPFPDCQIICDPFPIPDHWPAIGGLDVGFTAPTAAILLVKDPKTGIRYIVNEYAKNETDRRDHAQVLLGWGEGLRFETDPSANRTESDGKKTMKVYRELGLNVQNANNDVEHGIYTMFEGFKNGTLKIFSNMHGIRDELRFYQYDSGRIKKTKDHRIDGARYAAVGDASGLSKPMNWWAHQSRNRNRAGATNGDIYRPADANAGY